MLSLLKRHWFGFLVGWLTLMWLTVFLLVLFSPRQDQLNRGFIPCTKQMMQNIFNCPESKTWCLTKAIIENTRCDTMVILDGFGAWIKGKQKTPWENYLFTPQTSSIQDDEELKKYYEENPDIAAQMETLARQSQDAGLFLEEDEYEQTNEKPTL